MADRYTALTTINPLTYLSVRGSPSVVQAVMQFSGDQGDLAILDASKLTNLDAFYPQFIEIDTLVAPTDIAVRLSRNGLLKYLEPGCRHGLIIPNDSPLYVEFSARWNFNTKAFGIAPFGSYAFPVKISAFSVPMQEYKIPHVYADFNINGSIAAASTANIWTPGAVAPSGNKRRPLLDRSVVTFFGVRIGAAAGAGIVTLYYGGPVDAYSIVASFQIGASQHLFTGNLLTRPQADQGTFQNLDIENTSGGPVGYTVRIATFSNNPFSSPFVE